MNHDIDLMTQCQLPTPPKKGEFGAVLLEILCAFALVSLLMLMGLAYRVKISDSNYCSVALLRLLYESGSQLDRIGLDSSLLGQKQAKQGAISWSWQKLALSPALFTGDAVFNQPVRGVCLVCLKGACHIPRPCSISLITVIQTPTL